MSEISIILIRHGEASAAWGDDPDPGLSEKGISQASKLTTIKDLDQLDGYDFISSPKSRAVMTATPLIKKYNKNLKIDNAFTEIPSTNVEPKDKKEWLSNIVNMKLCSLPEEVNSWRLKLIRKIMERERNTIIFSHFMVINALIAEFINNDKLLCFYPDYTSLTKILVKNNEVTELYFGDERKTLINL